MFGMVPWWKKGTEPAVMDPFDRLRNEFKALYDRVFAGFPTPAEKFDWEKEYFWNIDINDTEKEIFVRAEVPGFEKEDFDLRLLGDYLVIKAEHRIEEEPKKEEEAKEEYATTRRLRRYYERRVMLPVAVDLDKAEARYHNGILEVHLPKTKEAVARRIPVLS